MTRTTKKWAVSAALIENYMEGEVFHFSVFAESEKQARSLAVSRFRTKERQRINVVIHSIVAVEEIFGYMDDEKFWELAEVTVKEL